MAKRDYERGGIPYAFVAIPKEVLSMPEYQSLPASSKALLLDLANQYTGKNNGRLTPSMQAMDRCGWASKGTLQRAKAALLEAPFVVLTRKGHPPRTTEWIAFTWWKCDYEKTMDIDPKSFPYLNFLPMRMGDPNTGRDQAKKQSMSPRNETVRTGKVVPRPPEMRPMEDAK